MFCKGKFIFNEALFNPSILSLTLCTCVDRTDATDETLEHTRMMRYPAKSDKT